MITLDIFADPACPWCYIGKARLDRALEARPEHPFAITWHPFQLNPSLPPEGMERAAYLRAKFGAGAEGYALPILQAAQESGLNLNLAAITRQPNTRDALRLLHWAGIEARQSLVMAALCRAFWVEGRDISRPEVLEEIAGAAGMERAVVRRLLSGEADHDEIARREAHARERGITALPTFLLGNTHVIEGAQPTDFWLRVIDELAPAG